jgi:hypothetical protein
MRNDTTKTHSTPLVGIKPNEFSHLVAGVGFEPTTFRLCDLITKPMAYRKQEWLGRYQSANLSTRQMFFLTI